MVAIVVAIGAVVALLRSFGRDVSTWVDFQALVEAGGEVVVAGVDKAGGHIVVHGVKRSILLEENVRMRS